MNEIRILEFHFEPERSFNVSIKLKKLIGDSMQSIIRDSEKLEKLDQGWDWHLNLHCEKGVNHLVVYKQPDSNKKHRSKLFSAVIPEQYILDNEGEVYDPKKYVWYYYEAVLYLIKETLDDELTKKVNEIRDKNILVVGKDKSYHANGAYKVDLSDEVLMKILGKIPK